MFFPHPHSFACRSFWHEALNISSSLLGSRLHTHAAQFIEIFDSCSFLRATSVFKAYLHTADMLRQTQSALLKWYTYTVQLVVSFYNVTLVTVTTGAIMSAELPSACAPLLSVIPLTPLEGLSLHLLPTFLRVTSLYFTGRTTKSLWPHFREYISEAWTGVDYIWDQTWLNSAAVPVVTGSMWHTDSHSIYFRAVRINTFNVLIN